MLSPKYNFMIKVKTEEVVWRNKKRDAFFDNAKFLLILLVVFIIINHIPNINRYVFFGSRPYEDFIGIIKLGWLVRLFSLTLGVIGIIGFLSIVPSKECLFTPWGKKTLIVYLLHGFVVRGLRIIEIPKYNIYNCPNIVIFLLLIIGSWVLTIFLASQPITKLYKKLININAGRSQ